VVGVLSGLDDEHDVILVNNKITAIIVLIFIPLRERGIV
jgi:hypothetical protein